MGEEWVSIILEPVKSLLFQLAAYIPNILGALFILIVGWLISRLIKSLSIRGLKLFRFDTASEKAGLTDLLKKGGIKASPAELIGMLLYWLVLLIVVIIVINVLGIAAATQILQQILLFIPKVISAVFVLTICIFLANFIAGILKTALNNAGVKQANLIASVAQWIIITFGAFMALQQLDIATVMLTSVFTIVLGGICLAFAIAVGLGAKDIAAHYLKKYFLEKEEKEE